ncbi:SIR2 family NAD-dependent protein deacylase [Thermophilibacter sp. ZX-H3]|uniref:SIR2 family NAD-dependent protein deacylase n=1 Tax=Atopobiaceae TaxID=1643824 RepID=UPI00143993D7|nr:Sir2 silent information regulator family NAD-dependent deacetylase [Olsenella sp. SW781]NJE79996.1 Sir2 silent information regulator family NAD-dependent deacetylase [Olsenella sp. SW781]
MFFSTLTSASTRSSSTELERLADALDAADAVLVGAGAGLSTAAGLTYSGARFREHFSDFIEKYGFTDMYSGGFFPFPSEEERWAYWSRYIKINRYDPVPTPLYEHLLEALGEKDFFVLTTNVDHCFQRAGFPKGRLFYTQGDYGLWQCGVPCHARTYDNEAAVLRMVAEQRDMRVPAGLVPRCPVCGAPMTMNLRADDTFVEDEGWHAAATHYRDFVRRHRGSRLLLLEIGVGANTPVIIKYPFWRMAAENPRATYACVNLGEAVAPAEIAEQSILLDVGAAEVI